VTVRELRKSDIPFLKRWHTESGFDYPFPEIKAMTWWRVMLRDLLMRCLTLLCGEFARVSVVTDENNLPVMAAPAKKTIEMYLLCDKDWGTPRQRLMALQLGHEEMRVWLSGHGFCDVNAWLPPEIEKAFGKRLQYIFGWKKSRWNSYSRRTAGDF
jgi:hypothetical protein